MVYKFYDTVMILLFFFFNLLMYITMVTSVLVILGPDQRNAANAVFASWMAVGNILGFLSGASGQWHR